MSETAPTVNFIEENVITRPLGGVGTTESVYTMSEAEQWVVEVGSYEIAATGISY